MTRHLCGFLAEEGTEHLPSRGGHPKGLGGNRRSLRLAGWRPGVGSTLVRAGSAWGR